MIFENLLEVFGEVSIHTLDGVTEPRNSPVPRPPVVVLQLVPIIDVENIREPASTVPPGVTDAVLEDDVISAMTSEDVVHFRRRTARVDLIHLKEREKKGDII